VSETSPKDVLTIEEAAELLGVSVKTFNKVLHSESLPGRKIGREWKFSRQALIDWIGAGRSDDFYRDPREVRPAPNGRGEPRTQASADERGARRVTGWRVKND